MKALKIGEITNTTLSSLKVDLFNYQELFDIETWRQSVEGSPHKNTKTIFLRSCPELTRDSVFNSLIAETAPEMDLLFSFKEVILLIMSISQCVELGRVMLISLAGESEIDAHVDSGMYPSYYERFHLPIISEDTSFIVEDEEFKMKEGELWLIDNLKEHKVTNNSKTPRVHLVVDIKRL